MFNPLLSRRLGSSFFTNNSVKPLEILKSNFFPSFKRSVQNLGRKSVRNGSRSSTWQNYNKHYNRTPWDKLKKPAAFTLAFCAGTTLATPYLFDYTPLSYFKKRPLYFVYSLIALNVGVFLAWRVPQLSRYMNRYALIYKENLQSQLSLLGAAFSHQNLGHLFVNMFVLQSFGTVLCSVVGVSSFAAMYLNSAVIASFISIALPTVLRSSLAGVASLGASGAVFAVFGAFSYLIPKAGMAFFFVPVPGGAWVLFLGSVAYNVVGIALKWGRYDYAAHIGGSIAGVAYGWWFSKRRTQTKQRVYR